MSDQSAEYDVPFYQLIISLQTSANQQMGKVPNPFTGKTQLNLEMARTTIDMMEMLKRKTQGNLTDDENKLMDAYLYQLRMNYLEVSQAKGEADTTTGSATPETDKN
ncbi:MAG: DUF1844 domain-containing protein [candidate division Zixibacteria bacterium]|nr:DUF1844 domain-containing protein [candidate division Zixibacteria bacterium]